jgi:hypothetical protein
MMTATALCVNFTLLWWKADSSLTERTGRNLSSLGAALTFAPTPRLRQLLKLYCVFSDNCYAFTEQAQKNLVPVVQPITTPFCG